MKTIDELLYRSGRLNPYDAVRYVKNKFYSSCTKKSPCEKEKSLVLFTDVRPDDATKIVLEDLGESGIKVKLMFMSKDASKIDNIDFKSDNIDIISVNSGDGADDNLDGIIDSKGTLCVISPINSFSLFLFI